VSEKAYLYTIPRREKILSKSESFTKFMRGSRVVLITCIVLAFLLLGLSAGAETSQWKVSWVNQRQEPDLADSWFELFPMSIVKNQGHAEYDGGYTIHIHLKTGPRIWWGGKQVSYKEDYAVFAHLVVSGWNASLKFAAENYEWGRHLSKLRLKFYTDANVSKAPHIDVVVDPTEAPSSNAYLTFYGTWPMKIVGNLDALSSGLYFALGGGSGRWLIVNDQRGWLSQRTFSPPSTFILYGLALRWESLKNSASGSRIDFPEYRTIQYKDVANKIKPLYSSPGVVWAYYYPLLYERGGVEKPLLVNGTFQMQTKNRTSVLMKADPRKASWSWYPVTFYGGTVCIHPFDWIYQFTDLMVEVIPPRANFFVNETTHTIWARSADIPILQNFNNDTVLLLHGLDIGTAILNSTWTWAGEKSDNRYKDVWVPLKYFTDDLLKEMSIDTEIENVDVIDSLGPAADKVARISYRDGRVCLEGLKERVLVEMRIGRAYKVDAPVEPVAVEGKTHRDRNGVYWVLKGSSVYFKPLNNTFSPEKGVRYVWRGVNQTIKVDGPLNMANPSFSRFWKKQYLVEVDSPYSFDGVGWFDEGSKAAPKPSGGYVDLANGTRLILKGFEGFGSAEVVVDKPLVLKPVWERMYRVDVESRYVRSERAGYVKQGETASIQMPKVKDFGNGSKVELVTMKAYGPAGETLAQWDGVSGDAENALLKFTIDRPVTVKVEWKLFQKLTVRSQVNSYEEWVLNGTVHRLNLPEKKQVGQDTLMVLRKITVNGRPYEGFELLVTSPTSVEATYQRKLLVTLMIEAGKDRLVEPEEVVLARDGETEVYRPPSTYIGEGLWRITRISYLGGDVSTEAAIDVNKPGVKTIQSRLRTVEITVTDVMGIPIPYVSLNAPKTESVTDLSGKASMAAIPPWDFEVTAQHALGKGAATIKPGEATARITAGVSPYTLAIIATAAITGIVVWRRKMSKPSR
jgi:hypothetical protein